MPKGYALHIGLNYVDPDHYGGWEGKLNACEYDAKDMQQIAINAGFDTTTLLREKATRTSVINKIKERSKKIESGDIFLITYSGHGGSLRDTNSDDADGRDETWCLFDGQLIDDELANLWALFPEGSRVLLFSDSCHSGTMTKNFSQFAGAQAFNNIKAIPEDTARSTYYLHQHFYDRIVKKNSKLNAIACSVKLISGCQDDQSSYDGESNGQFTEALKNVWNDGSFNGNYAVFHRKILQRINNPDQLPNYTNAGVLNTAFDKQKPFSI